MNSLPPIVARFLTIGIAITCLLAGPQANATWSIVMANCETGEVSVGTVTCLTGFNLRSIVPVIVVGEGAAAAQARGDWEGTRRPIIFNELMNGTSPDAILALLASINAHQQMQYGIVDVRGGTTTFTGRQAFAWAGGVTGRDGAIVYSIQGNILAGDCVVPAIEAAITSTPGDMAQKLMAGMEAAFDLGGDGRCSCSPSAPTSCGCPPANFTKAGHIGCMLVARIGDTDDPRCNANGCADGDYFMALNVAGQTQGSPDPVAQLRQQFDAWRTALVGRPDAVESIVTLDPPIILPDGQSTSSLFIELRDWQGNPLSTPITSLDVTHAAASAGLASIGLPVDLGNGRYEVTLTAGSEAGVDRFEIRVDDGVRPITLMPVPTLEHTNLSDVEVVIGDLIAGGLVEITVADDEVLHARSVRIAHSLSQLNKVEVMVRATVDRQGTQFIDIEFESRVSEPAGVVRVGLRNWTTGQMDMLGHFAAGLDDRHHTLADISAAAYVAPNGQIEMVIHHSVLALFLGSTFDAFIDQVRIDPR